MMHFILLAGITSVLPLTALSKSYTKSVDCKIDIACSNHGIDCKDLLRVDKRKMSVTNVHHQKLGELEEFALSLNGNQQDRLFSSRSASFDTALPRFGRQYRNERNIFMNSMEEGEWRSGGPPRLGKKEVELPRLNKRRMAESLMRLEKIRGINGVKGGSNYNIDVKKAKAKVTGVVQKKDLTPTKPQDNQSIPILEGSSVVLPRFKYLLAALSPNIDGQEVFNET